MSLAITEDVATVEVTEENEIVVITEELISTVELGVEGPQGPPGQGIDSGPIASRPATDDEGSIYAATDEDKLYVYFE